MEGLEREPVSNQSGGRFSYEEEKELHNDYKKLIDLVHAHKITTEKFIELEQDLFEKFKKKPWSWQLYAPVETHWARNKEMFMRKVEMWKEQMHDQNPKARSSTYYDIDRSVPVKVPMDPEVEKILSWFARQKDPDPETSNAIYQLRSYFSTRRSIEVY